MTGTQPIPCDLHDQIEASCMYRYELDVTLIDGTTIRGRAVTTQTAIGIELLELDVDARTHAVPMHKIVAIAVLTPHARLSTLTF